MFQRLARAARFFILPMLFLSAAAAAGGTFRAAPRGGVPGVYLVVLADGVARKGSDRGSSLPAVAEVAQELARAHGGQAGEVWSDALRGFVVRMPEARARKLAEDSRVLAVEQQFDVDVTLAAPVGDCYRGNEFADARPLPSGSASPQVLDCSNPDPLADNGPAGAAPVCRDNWGLDRVDQETGRNERFQFVNNGTGVHVYVLDSGIRRSHEEFRDASNSPDSSRVLAGIDARFDPIRPDNGTSTNDCYGHGTHVAGIIAGRTYGIAKNALLHPIRVIGPDPLKTVASPGCPLDGQGDPMSLKVVRALNWIVANAQRPAVVNWSGGNDFTLMSSPTLGAAVQGVLNAGILFVQAAGNQTGDYSPQLAGDACGLSLGGRYPAVIVAGGMDEYEGRWVRRMSDPGDDPYRALGDVGSNVGSCVDIWAPAAHIISASYDRDQTVANDLACRLSGTSMAAPHVAGAVAVYLQSNPNATAAEVERALRSRGSWNRLLSGDSLPNSIGRGSDNVVLFADTRSAGPDLPPVASFFASCPGRQCVFDATSSSDDAGITSYTWDLGGGVTASGPVVRHTYGSVDTVRVTLRVTDAGNRTDHAMQAVMPRNDPPPAASFTVTCSGRTCSVNGSASNDNAGIASYQWSWGDSTSTTTTGPATSHVYGPGPSSFTITLTVTDTVGQIATTTRPVTVNQTPVPQVTFFCEGKSCRFDGSTSSDDGAIVKYLFEYFAPDAAGNWVKTSGVEQSSPVHDYPGFPLERFQVRLSVQDSVGTWSAAPAVRHGVAKAVTEVSLAFYATEPCTLGASAITMDVPKLVQARGTACVPAGSDITAVAAVVRLTNTAAYPGYLRIGDDAATSVLNLAAARAEHSNFVVLPLNGAGQVELILKQFGSPAPTTATLTVDVAGYYRRVSASLPTIETGGTVGPLWFQPLAPCLLFDTRTEAPGLASGTPRLFDLRNRCGVTSTAAAVALQGAIVNPTTNGRVAAYASASNAPAAAASMEATADRNVSSAIVSKLANGSLKVATTVGAADLTLATTGVFTRTSGQSFFVTPPCRLLDTRQNVNGKSRLAHNVPTSFQVRGQCGIPSHASAALLYVTVVQADGIGHVRVYATGGAVAGYAAANFKASESIGSSVIVPLGATLDDVTALLMLAGSGAHLVVDSYGYFSGRTNVARSAAVSVSSTYDPVRFPPASMVDGDRRGLGWGSGTGGWSDGTRMEWPDNVGLTLPAPKWIEEIDLFTLPDNYASGTDPYEGLAFTEDGIQDFSIFYRDLATGAWVPVATVTNNDQVWRRFVLPQPIRTAEIWISISRSLTNYSRIVEVELWEAE